MYEKLIYNLKKKYPETNFKINKQEYFSELIYDNKKYIDDISFREEVLEECIKFLEMDEIFNLAIVYDFLDEVKCLYKLELESFEDDIEFIYPDNSISLKLEKNVRLDISTKVEFGRLYESSNLGNRFSFGNYNLSTRVENKVHYIN